MVAGNTLPGDGDGTVMTNGILGNAHFVGSLLRTPRGSVSAKTSMISPMYAIVPGGAVPGSGATHNGVAGTCAAAGENGAACSWESVVTVLWVVNAHACTNLVRGRPLLARVS